MASGTIIFSDVVGFSKLSTIEQKVVVNSLTNEIMYEIREHLAGNLSIMPNAIALPTGDGVAIVLVHNEPNVWSTEILVRLILRLVGWQTRTKGTKEVGREMKIRVGVHYGGLEFFTDINGRTNVCGNTINMAQRVMDAANDSQVLISNEACRHYFGASYVRSFEHEDLTVGIGIRGPLSVTVKHGVRLEVFVLTIDGIAVYDNNSPGSSKYLVVSTTKLPKLIEGDFEEKLRNGTEVALIQLTGENLLQRLESGASYFSSSLRRLFILMPSSKNPLFQNVNENSPGSDHSRFIERWKAVVEQLRGRIQGLNARLYLFDEPPYFGGSFVDWTSPNGSIHISPYVWGIPARECPGYDMVWTGVEEPEIFKKYVQGLDFLIGRTRESFS